MDPGVKFSTVLPPVINNADQVAFTAGIQWRHRTKGGIWRDSQGILDLVVRIGDQAPGTVAGDTFEDFIVARPIPSCY